MKDIRRKCEVYVYNLYVIISTLTTDAFIASVYNEHRTWQIPARQPEKNIENLNTHLFQI